MTKSQLRRRYWRIVFFFGRAVGSFIVWETILPRFGLRGLTRSTRANRNRRIAVAFRAMAIRMGGLMIKVGQFLSARLDVLPEEITRELADLQDEVPAETFSAIRAQAEAELGASLETHYEWVEEAPLAAASLGQVHRARLRESDAARSGFSDVVVKVQRPGIEAIVETDLTALRLVGTWLQRYRPIADRANVPGLLEEFASTTAEEIDYLAEARNAGIFAEIFESDPRVYVPEVVWDLTTRRVLTLEDVSAIKLTDYDAITAAGIDRRQVASVLLSTYFQQIFEDGFFHADPHPGNIFVTPLGGVDTHGEPNWCLTFVDFGMVGRMPEHLRDGLREMLIAIGTQDAARLVQSYRTLGVLLPSADTARIEAASMQVFNRFWGKSMAELRQIDHRELAQFGFQFRELMLEMPFQLPENLLLLGRTVAILSGMCTGMDPEFNVWSEIAPYATGLIADEGGSNWEMWLAEGTRMLQTLIALPTRMDRVLTAAERGELAVRNPALELRVRRVEKSVNRVAGAIAFAALLIAGAILYPANAQLAGWLMGASALPLLWAILAGRGGHPLR
jgi:predicted unusual protein kinase regulating ubiquinone biosynthesis (AarF/ABC1/UbiB family)